MTSKMGHRPTRPAPAKTTPPRAANSMSEEDDTRKRPREEDDNGGAKEVCPASSDVGQSGGKWDSAVSLETLREKLDSFAKERTWDQHHEPRNLCLALVGEIGELCECFQWKKDPESQPGLPAWSQKDKEHLGEELSDVLLYLLRLADKCEIDLPAAALRKLEKNAKKYPAHLVKGSREKYTAYESGEASKVQEEEAPDAKRHRAS